MTLKDGLVSVCPVPEEQQPINEYQQLKESWLFQWPTYSLRQYITKMAWVWSLAWLITGPVAAASFAPKKHLGQFLLSGAAGATFILALILLRLYLGWSYVRSRLKSTTVDYEESGWYDGQVWTKTPEILMRDRLLVTHQVEPILRRLKQTFAVLAAFCVLGGILWNFLSAINPS